MYRLLLAVDGSEQSHRGVSYLIGLLQQGVLQGRQPSVQVVNVQPCLPEAISFAMSAAQLSEHYQQATEAECRVAMDLLSGAGLQGQLHPRIGSPADEIVACAAELDCAAIVLGAHGAGMALAALLGSVASRVLKLAEVPVTLIK